jgi:feruloyl esterase
MITRAVVEACDGDDGLKDGLVEDPRRCRFDPMTLVCEGQGDGDCLTAQQARAVQKIYDGVRNPRTGDQIFTGWPKGSEGFGSSPIQSWRTYVLDPPEPMRVGFFRYFLFHDPNWDWRTIDWERDLAYAERKLGFMSATERDLTPFERRGGKLLMYAGWADPVVPPQDNVAYYEAVTQAMGGAERVRRFFRLFMAPGMGHCSGGPGPNQFDALAALERWVEQGEAPGKLVASHSTDGRIDRTRPLCPYPQVARYQGRGSVDDHASFACVSGAAAARRPQGQR